VVGFDVVHNICQQLLQRCRRMNDASTHYN
jgi:hypothetical protein